MSSLASPSSHFRGSRFDRGEGKSKPGGSGGIRTCSWSEVSLISWESLPLTRQADWGLYQHQEASGGRRGPGLLTLVLHLAFHAKCFSSIQGVLLASSWTSSVTGIILQERVSASVAPWLDQQFYNNSLPRCPVLASSVLVLPGLWLACMLL